MKGTEYFKWFTNKEKSEWLENFRKQELQDDLNRFMLRDFPNYHIFFFLGFDIRKSKEGHSYWLTIFYRNRKFDNMSVKPGFSYKGLYNQPKVF